MRTQCFSSTYYSAMGFFIIVFFFFWHGYCLRVFAVVTTFRHLRHVSNNGVGTEFRKLEFIRTTRRIFSNEIHRCVPLQFDVLFYIPNSLSKKINSYYYNYNSKSIQHSVENIHSKYCFFYFEQLVGPSCHNMIQGIWKILISRPATPPLPVTILQCLFTVFNA